MRKLASDGKANPRKLMHHRINPDKCVEYMREYGDLWFVEGYLVFFALSTPWYSDELILSELLIVRVGPGGTLRDVARFLMDRAAVHGAAIVAVGTAYAKSDRALARLYEAQGFTVEAVMLTARTPCALA